MLFMKKDSHEQKKKLDLSKVHRPTIKLITSWKTPIDRYFFTPWS